LKLICPYEENEIGLEKKKECRSKILELVLKNHLEFEKIHFLGNNIVKTYDKKILTKYINNVKFIYSKKFKLLYSHIFNLNRIDDKKIILEPVEFLMNNNKFRHFLIEKCRNINSLEFLYNIALYLEMGYDIDETYYRIFEPDINIDESWFANISIIKEIKNLPCATIKIIRKGSSYLYYISLEESFQYDSSSLKKLGVLYKMAGPSDNLKRLAAVLEDDDVQEIYIDRENSWIYIDHIKFGRCDTNVFMSCVDVEKFKTAISLISGEEISISNPSIKINVIDSNANFRIAVDVFPIVLNTAVDIRRFTSRMLSIRDLIRLGSIEPKIAAFLIYCARKRLSIVICGEPNSGKTTLANAISEYLPKEWRKVYIEDVEEVYASTNFSKDKSVFIKTSSIDVPEKYSSKSMEIVKLLHRSPDWIFLGEIQTKEHSQAAFHALLAGLKGMMTCHASSVPELINRWIYQHEIQPICINSLDLIVYMEKSLEENKIIRKLKNVFEIEIDEKHQQINFKEIYNSTMTNFSLDEENLLKLRCIRKIMATCNCDIYEIISDIMHIEESIKNG